MNEKDRPVDFDDLVEFGHRVLEAGQAEGDEDGPGGDPEQGDGVNDAGPIFSSRAVGGKEMHSEKP